MDKSFNALDKKINRYRISLDETAKKIRQEFKRLSEN